MFDYEIIVSRYEMRMLVQVWNCLLHYEVHTFTGHTRAVTGNQLAFIEYIHVYAAATCHAPNLCVQLCMW